ncbi:hypothetical protein CDIK_0695 [Cucumispora dikerogammari]|nr:hypothetical protein CDIK_0695 [Cucumispora dikerogammari]
MSSKLSMMHDISKELPDIKYRETIIKRGLVEYFNSKSYAFVKQIKFEYSTTTVLPIFFNLWTKSEIVLDFIELMMEKFNHIAVMKMGDFKNYQKKFKNIYEKGETRKANVTQVAKRKKNEKLIKILSSYSRNGYSYFEAGTVDLKRINNYVCVFISIKEYFSTAEYLKHFAFEVELLHFPFLKLLKKYFNRLVPESIQCEWVALLKEVYKCKCENGCYFNAVISSNCDPLCIAAVPYYKNKYLSRILGNNEESKKRQIQISKLNNSSACDCPNRVSITEKEKTIKDICLRFKQLSLRPDFLLNALLNFNEEVENIKESLPYSLKLTMNDMQLSSVAEGILKHGCFLYDDITYVGLEDHCYCHSCVNINDKTLPIPVHLSFIDIKFIDKKGVETYDQVTLNFDDYDIYNFRNSPQPDMFVENSEFYSDNEYSDFTDDEAGLSDFAIFTDHLIEDIWRLGERNYRGVVVPRVLESSSDVAAYSDDEMYLVNLNASSERIEYDVPDIDSDFPSMSISDFSSYVASDSNENNEGENENVSEDGININFNSPLNIIYPVYDAPDTHNPDIPNAEDELDRPDIPETTNDINGEIDKTERLRNIGDIGSQSDKPKDQKVVTAIEDETDKENRFIQQPINKSEDIRIEISNFDSNGLFRSDFLFTKTSMIYEQDVHHKKYEKPTEAVLMCDEHLFTARKNNEETPIAINYYETREDTLDISEWNGTAYRSRYSLYPTYKKEDIYPFRRNHIVIPLAIMYLYKDEWPLVVICRPQEKSEWEKVSIHCLNEWQRIDSYFETTAVEIVETEENKYIEEIFSEVKYNFEETLFVDYFDYIYHEGSRNILIPVIIEMPKISKCSLDVEMSWRVAQVSSTEEQICSEASPFLKGASLISNKKEKIFLSVIRTGKMLSSFECATISRYILQIEKKINETLNIQESEGTITREQVFEKLKFFINTEYLNLDHDKSKRVVNLKNKFKKLKDEIFNPLCLTHKIKIMSTRSFISDFQKQKNNLIDKPEIDFLNSNYCTIVTSETDNIKLFSNFEEVAIRSRRLILRNSPTKSFSMCQKIDMLVTSFKNYKNWNETIMGIKSYSPTEKAQYLELFKTLFTNYKNFCFTGTSLVREEQFEFFKFNVHEIFYGLIYVFL